jgi:hypothetical protein
MNDGANKLGGAVEQGFEIQGGIEGVSQLNQVGDVCRVYPCIDRVATDRRVGGAVIPFEIGWFGRRWGNGWHRR